MIEMVLCATTEWRRPTRRSACTTSRSHIKCTTRQWQIACTNGSSSVRRRQAVLVLGSAPIYRHAEKPTAMTPQHCYYVWWLPLPPFFVIPTVNDQH